MILNWRDTLRTLQAQFEAAAAKSAGLNHLMVEAGNEERDKLVGPEWFGGMLGHGKVVNGELRYGDRRRITVPSR